MSQDQRPFRELNELLKEIWIPKIMEDWEWDRKFKENFQKLVRAERIRRRMEIFR